MTDAGKVPEGTIIVRDAGPVRAIAAQGLTFGSPLSNIPLRAAVALPETARGTGRLITLDKDLRATARAAARG